MTPGLTALRLAWREGGLRGPVLFALAAWAGLVLWDVNAGGPPCGGTHHATATGLSGRCVATASFELMLMVAAMMTPLVAPIFNHVWRSSLAHRRPDSLAAVALGYGACWMAAGAVLVPAAATWGRSWSAALATLALSVAWSCSPAAQYARNRCHRVRGISPFGLAADRDSFVQGVMTGAPCVLACWPWMLVPMAVPAGHHAAAVAVTLLLFLERLARPRSPAWRSPPALEALRLLGPRSTTVS